MIKFIKEIDSVSSYTAVKTLCDLANIPLEQLSSVNATNPSKQHTRLLECLDKAAAFYCDELRHPQRGRPALVHIQTRKLSPETVHSFRLGFAMDSYSSLTAFLTAEGFSAAEMASAGLALESAGTDSKPRMYDRFRNRLMVPISNARGEVVAFGGRALGTADTSLPKYYNSPSTPVFQKSKLLFGLDLARRAISDEGCVVVEGYFDVMCMHEAGVRNVVGALGSSISKEQIESGVSTARRKVVTLLFDADDAGGRAVEKACESVFPTVNHDIEIRVAYLGDATGAPFTIASAQGGMASIKDPGDLFVHYGARSGQLLREVIDRAVDWKQWKVASILSGYNLGDAKSSPAQALGDMGARSKAVQELVRFICSIKTPTDRTLLVYHAAEKLCAGRAALKHQLEIDMLRMVDASNRAVEEAALLKKPPVNKPPVNKPPAMPSAFETSSDSEEVFEDLEIDLESTEFTTEGGMCGAMGVIDMRKKRRRYEPPPVAWEDSVGVEGLALSAAQGRLLDAEALLLTVFVHAPTLRCYVRDAVLAAADGWIGGDSDSTPAGLGSVEGLCRAAAFWTSPELRQVYVIAESIEQASAVSDDDITSKDFARSIYVSAPEEIQRSNVSLSILRGDMLVDRSPSNLEYAVHHACCVVADFKARLTQIRSLALVDAKRADALGGEASLEESREDLSSQRQYDLFLATQDSTVGSSGSFQGIHSLGSVKRRGADVVYTVDGVEAKEGEEDDYGDSWSYEEVTDPAEDGRYKFVLDDSMIVSEEWSAEEEEASAEISSAGSTTGVSFGLDDIYDDSYVSVPDLYKEDRYRKFSTGPRRGGGGGRGSTSPSTSKSFPSKSVRKPVSAGKSIAKDSQKTARVEPEEEEDDNRIPGGWVDMGDTLVRWDDDDIVV